MKNSTIMKIAQMEAKKYYEDPSGISKKVYEMLGDHHPERRLTAGPLRSRTEAIIPTVLIAKYNKVNGVQTPIYFNKTAINIGKTKYYCPPVDIIVQCNNGTMLGFEFNGAIHVAQLNTKGLANAAVVDAVIDQVKDKFKAIWNKKGSSITIAFCDNPSFYGGEENLKKIINELNKVPGINAVNMTAVDDAAINGNACPKKVYAYVERMRQFTQHVLNLTSNENYYAITPTDIQASLVLHYLYGHPYLSKDGVNALMHPPVLDSLKEYRDLWKKNHIPSGIGYASLPIQLVSKLQAEVTLPINQKMKTYKIGGKPVKLATVVKVAAKH